MPTGRNDLCSCGSGKKYKKCCMVKQPGKTEDSHEANGGSSADSDKNEYIFQFMNKMRNFLLRDKPHIKEYKKIRKLHDEIVTAMVDYHDAGKFELAVDAAYVAAPIEPGADKRDIACLLESEFDLETREGTQGYFDMLVYKSAPNMKCITEAFINSHRYRKPEKTEMLQSMMDSVLGLFEITAVDSGEGYANIKETFTGEEYRITDIGLSGIPNYMDIYIYTRIITYRNVSFGSGLNLVFSKNDSFIKNYITCRSKEHSSSGEFRRFVELYNYFTSNPNRFHIVGGNQ